MRARWSWRRRKAEVRATRGNQPRGQPSIGSQRGLRRGPRSAQADSQPPRSHTCGAATRRCLLAPPLRAELALRRQPRFWPCPPIRGGGLTRFIPLLLLGPGETSCSHLLASQPVGAGAHCGPFTLGAQRLPHLDFGGAINPERNCSVIW